jgi:(p)ppGpp synthase/HD superfamily hydrolase
MSSLLEKAIAIAVEAHRGQTDRYGAPYILHPLRVMGRVRTEPEQIVAVLHDVVEDTDWRLEDLKLEGFPEPLLKALDCVTKREGEHYEDYIRRAGSLPLARRVKLADLEDNMDVRRMSTVGPDELKRLAKYLTAWKVLSPAEAPGA